MGSVRFSLLLSVQTLLLLALPASGQTIDLRVVEEGAPVVGALVAVIDSTGSVVGLGLTGTDGLARLRMEPGRYRLRAELIGRRPTETGLFDIAAGESVQRTIGLEAQPVELAGISAEGEQRCEIRPVRGHDVHTAWQEARKALEAEQLGRSSALYRFDIEHFVREVRADNGRVLRDDRRSATNLSANPFRSLPVTRLAREGYLREGTDTDILYAPTPDVLLSDDFLDSHCFWLVRDGDGVPGALGLSFRPLKERTLTDVAGVLWIDEASAELRRMDFRYVFLPSRLPEGEYGGAAEFRRLPSGVWIVQRWTIRSPIPGIEQAVVRNRRVDVERAIAFYEEGAEVRRIAERDGALIDDAERATLAGTIRDSEGNALAGAVVVMAGTAFRATTDAAGRFRIAGVPEGRYRTTWTHELAVPGWPDPDVIDVALATGETTEIAFVMPVVPRGFADNFSVRDSTVWFAGTGFEQRRDRNTGLLYTTRRELELQGVEDIRDLLLRIPSVVIRSLLDGGSEFFFDSMSAPSGSVCEVSVYLNGAAVELGQFRWSGHQWTQRAVRSIRFDDLLTIDEIDAMEFYAPGASPVAAERDCGTLLFWSAKLTPRVNEAFVGTIRGVATDAETGRAIPRATIRIMGIDAAVQTSDTGEFRFTDVPPGEYRIDVQLPNARPWNATVEVKAFGVVNLDLQIESRQ